MKGSSVRKTSRRAAVAVRGSTLSLPRLSPSASDFVQRHPEQAAQIVSAALEAAVVQFDEKHSSTDIPERLRPFIVGRERPTESAEELLTADEAAERLRVSRATIYNWIDARRLIAWRVTRPGVLIPAEQIVGPGEVVSGIDKVLELIAEPRAAWRFLSEESPFFDTPRRPIDLLKQGRLEAVLKAARTSGEAFT